MVGCLLKFEFQVSNMRHTYTGIFILFSRFKLNRLSCLLLGDPTWQGRGGQDSSQFPSFNSFLLEVAAGSVCRCGVEEQQTCKLCAAFLLSWKKTNTYTQANYEIWIGFCMQIKYPCVCRSEPALCNVKILGTPHADNFNLFRFSLPRTTQGSK